MDVLGWGDARYPAWLAQIVDPPIVLWTRGDLSILSRASVAVVGSRRPSAVGLMVAERLAAGLARAGLVVTSGLATGIDGAAHRGALDGGGATVAVLGCGVDVTYPRTHAALATAVAAGGCLVSEFPPGTPPRTHHFPLRNRIISGLSRATVVVEAAERSGSLITARMALEQGRGVGAVPGPVLSGCHKGCHALIKDGARLVETVEDVLDEIGWRPDDRGAQADKPLFGNGLIGCMPAGTPMTIDEIARRAGFAGPAILVAIAELELTGRVRRQAGGYFVRLD
jgi:DNA processing protein